MATVTDSDSFHWNDTTVSPVGQVDADAFTWAENQPHRQTTASFPSGAVVTIGQQGTAIYTPPPV